MERFFAGRRLRVVDAGATLWFYGHITQLGTCWFCSREQNPRVRPASLHQRSVAGWSWIRGFSLAECSESRKPQAVLLSLHLLPSLCSFLFFSFSRNRSD